MRRMNYFSAGILSVVALSACGGASNNTSSTTNTTAAPTDAPEASGTPATPPSTYVTVQGHVRVKDSTFYVNIANAARVHDFGPSGGFVDETTNVPRLATILVATGVNKNTFLSGSQIPKYGVPGHVEWTSDAVIMANRPGEGQEGKECRAQASSYQVAPDTPLVWKLRVQLGDQSDGKQWQFLPNGQDPVLLWQVKAPGLQPSLSMVADTDDNDPSRLMLSFNERGGSASTPTRVGAIHGVAAGIPIEVRIEAVLDERNPEAEGAGRWRAIVDGVEVFNRTAPTLSTLATEPHQWFFGIYRYKTFCPSVVPRWTRWEQVRLERSK
jgi:hypothetical protein